MKKKTVRSAKVMSQKGKVAVGVGVGVAVVAAAAAGTYFLYGKRGAKSRKKIKGWMLKAKGEVLEQLERLKHVDASIYRTVIDGVAKRYKNVNKKELDRVVKELKSHWASISRDSAAKKKKTVRKKKKATASRPRNMASAAAVR